jgi:hypothetical protein
MQVFIPSSQINAASPDPSLNNPKMSFESPLPPYNASDPNATFLNSSCLDLLMIELVPMAYRVVNEVDAAGIDDRIIEKKEKDTGGSSSLKGSVANGTAGSTNGRKMDEEEERDAVFFRLEMLGYRVGQGLVERFVDVSLPPIFCSGVPWRGQTRVNLSSNPQSVRDIKAKTLLPQILSRQTPLYRYPRRNQIPLQRPLDASF